MLFLSELRRRNVLRVSIANLAGADGRGRNDAGAARGYRTRTISAELEAQLKQEVVIE